MEPNNIDSVFRKMIQETKGYYDPEANNAKKQIWNQIALEETSSRPTMFRLLVAACILLFFSTSLIAYINYQTQTTNNKLTILSSELENQLDKAKMNQIQYDKSLAAINKNTTDTVYIEKQVIINKSIIQKVNIIDTVFVNQIVYVEKEIDLESAALLVDNNFSSDSSFQILSDNYETEIIISSDKPIKKRKSRKFQLIFGGSKANKGDGNLALSSKL